MIKGISFDRFIADKLKASQELALMETKMVRELSAPVPEINTLEELEDAIDRELEVAKQYGVFSTILALKKVNKMVKQYKNNVKRKGEVL